ncbi:MAG: hypothetical protein IPH45_03610 [Bacteroidales bacterium]|nr:hypothetical protein [Bacteroidales bacterium]
MKKTGFIILQSVFTLCLFIAVPLTKVHAQFYFWLPQQALTDSSADNTNPCLVSYKDNFWDDQILIFWERSTDSSSTSLYYRGIEDGILTEPIELLSAPGVHFRHPLYMIPDYQPIQDTAFILFYESDISGQKGIYYMKYNLNGNFSAPQELSMLPGDDLNLCISNSWGKYVTWENQGKILVSNLNVSNLSFYPPEVLVDANGSDPAGTEGNLLYLDTPDDSSNVYYFEREYQSGNYLFTGPNELYSRGQSSEIEQCKGFNEFGASNGLYVWQNKIPGEKLGVMYAELHYFGPEIFEHRSTQFNYHSPDLFDFPIVTKFPSFITFVTDSLGNDEIMTGYPNTIGFYENQSEFEGPDRNPHFFSSVDQGVFQIQLLWESLRDGHWTIFRTHYDMVFGAEEYKGMEMLKAVPNPYHETCQIIVPQGTFEGQLDIFNSKGVVIKSFSIPPGNLSSYTIEWDGTSANSTEVSPGIYFARYCNHEGDFHIKIIRSNN